MPAYLKQTTEKSYQLFFRSTIELGYICFQAKKKNSKYRYIFFDGGHALHVL